MVTIVVSGKPGAGSSTTTKLLAKRLGLEYFSAGNYFKQFGTGKETEKAVTFWRTKKGSSKEFHNKLEALQKKKALEGNIAIESKLGIRMLKGCYDFSVWIEASKEERARRYVKRDNIALSDALAQIKEKEMHERSKWKKIYGFDSFSQKKNAHLVIDTTNKKPEAIVEEILTKMKRVFIVHRWEAKPASDWYPYVEREMKKKGYVVNTLAMPDTHKPTLGKWLHFLKKSIGEPTENTYLVGHSAGVATILRYLESLSKGKKVGGCVLVAGWIDDMCYKQLSSFAEKPLNWKKIKEHCKKFVVVQSDNDPYVKMYHALAFQKNLGAKLIVEHKKGHLTDDEKIKTLPAVVKSLETM